MNNREHWTTVMGLTRAVSLACILGGIVYVYKYKEGVSEMGTHIAVGVTVFGAFLLIGAILAELFLPGRPNRLE